MATSGTPINRPVQPRFGAESGLQSPLGSGALTNQWKKTKVPSNSTFGLAVAMARLERIVAQLRRRVITPPSTPVELENMFPFKIYQIDNITDDSHSPYTFQIRCGLIGLRGNPTSNTGSLVGNFEDQNFCMNTDFKLGQSAVPYLQTVSFDWQPTPNDGGEIILSNASDTIIDNNTQIVLDSTLDGDGYSRASFWQDFSFGSGAGGDLMGRMWSENPGGTGRQINPFPPPNQDIYPIGTISNKTSESTSDFVIRQIITGNLVGRYPTSSIGTGGVTSLSLLLFYRGYWNLNTLSGKCFTNGDRVVDDSTILHAISGNNFYGVYNYIGGSNVETAHPVVGVKWALDSMVIL